MKYTNTYINRNLIESAVIIFFSDVLLNIKPGLFNLDNYTLLKKCSVSIEYCSIFGFCPVTLVLAVILDRLYI